MPAKRKAAIEASKKLGSYKKPKIAAITSLNTPPTTILDVFVFGAGQMGELGLGAVKRDGKMPTNVRRPRLNDFLDAAKVGVVQVAVGGMHCAVLTHDNKILTWGVNDDGALGRDTPSVAVSIGDAAGSESDSDDGDTGLNPLECTPTAVPAASFEGNPVWVQVVATDSACFALTTEGDVYGWGTFLGSDGAIGFSLETFRDGVKKQMTPLRIKALENITQLAAGGNHMLALDSTGNVYTWGDAEQYQLGRRVLPTYRERALTPTLQAGLHRQNTKYISAGAWHSFTIDQQDRLWAWGLNNYGQAGIPDHVPDDEDEDNHIMKYNHVVRPRLVRSLYGQVVKDVAGGNHHSVACLEDGEIVAWGRCGEGQMGSPLENWPDSDVIADRIVLRPVSVPEIKAIKVAAGSDNCLAISPEGKAYSWGYSENYRNGNGSEDIVEEASLIDNSAVKGRELVFAGCRGQFGVLAGVSDVQPARRGRSKGKAAAATGKVAKVEKATKAVKKEK